MGREKGRDLTQSYDKSPNTNRKVKRTKWQHKQRHKKFDYIAVTDRLRTVSLSNYGHPTGVVNLVYGPNLPTPRNSRVIKRMEGLYSVNQFNHTSWVAVVTPTDRPKSVRTRCVIEVFVAFFVLSRCFLLFFCRCSDVYHRTESDLFLFPEHCEAC